MNEVKQRIGILVGLFVFSLPASGHHTFPVFYNTSLISEMEGEVTEVLWSNPHVSFFLRTSDGEVWKIESNSVDQLARKAITPDVIRVGKVRVAGFPARNGDKGIYASNLMLAAGREEVLRPGVKPRWPNRNRSRQALLSKLRISLTDYLRSS